MRIVCLSDTHNLHQDLEVPDGDLLVHGGDMTLQGSAEEIERFALWLGGQPHRYKVVVAGNHDWLFERQPEQARALLGAAQYLQDSGLEIEGLRLWGSPWQPWFLSWAFNLPRGRALREKWEQIPEGTDILITHAPPRGIGDRVGRVLPRVVSLAIDHGAHVGCRELRSVVARLRPRLHVFGHIHEGYGQSQDHGTLFVNASNCDEHYRRVNPAVVVDL